MSNYDSILKEEVKYDDPLPILTEDEKKKFPWLLIDIILITIILIVSYFIYYKTILAPDKILLQDINVLYEKYKCIVEPSNLKEISTLNRLEGILTIDEKEYNYDVIKDNHKLKITLVNQNNILNYYRNNDEQYIKLSNFIDNYIKLNNLKISNKETLIKSFKSISKEKYKKNIYLDNKIPVVEANLILKEEEINNILGMTGYEAILTFKNNALTNDLINIKVTITNVKNNSRLLITYQNDEIKFKVDNNDAINLKLALKNDDFTLKIYKNDTIYSVLTGTKESNKYLYTYQIIDQIYNINIDVIKGDNNYQYQLKSKIENNNVVEENLASLTVNNKEKIILEEDVKDAKEYNNFSELEKENYKKSLELFIIDLRNFIEKYKQGINNVNPNDDNG